MLFGEQVVFFLTMLLVVADRKKESCEEYKYLIHRTNNMTKWESQWNFVGMEVLIDGNSTEATENTWDELIAAVPKLNSTDISCSVLHEGKFSILSGNLAAIHLFYYNFTTKRRIRQVDILVFLIYFQNNTKILDSHLLKNLLTLSNHLKYLYVKIKDFVITPAILEEGMFLSNKQLEKIEIEMHIKEIRLNTFLHLEKLKELSLVECRIQDFNPDELPSSLETLDLENNQLQTFHLTKPLPNLIKLDLSTNFLTRFILDMKDFLPNIRSVSLNNNKLMDFKPIDNNLNRTLTHLELDGNQIRNIDAYEWILQNGWKQSILTTWKGNYPMCDCSSKETLDTLAIEKIVNKCILTIPGDIQVEIGSFRCPGTGSHYSLCSHFSDVEHTWAVLNCSHTFWDPELFILLSGAYSNLITDLEEFYIYLSGTPDLTELPELPDLVDKRTNIHIYAENCNLHPPFSTENIPRQNLRHLYIANNSIDEVDVETLEELFEWKTHITLANNPLICDCQHKPMYDTLVKMSRLIDDFDQMTCDDGLPFANRDLCIAWDIILLYCGLVLSIVLICFLIIFLRYTLEIQVYIYSRGWFPAYFRTEPDEANYKYDVFVSYSDKDEDFVVSVIDFLEKEVSPPFKVCHHHRDWIVGERIDVQIITSVEESRKTVIILSPNFLTSFWANMEFRTALYTMLQEKAPKLVLIVHGDIGPTEKLKPEIRSYIKTTTYLASDDKWFWKKLAYSLRRPSKEANSESIEQGIQMKELNMKEENTQTTLETEWKEIEI